LPYVGDHPLQDIDVQTGIVEQYRGAGTRRADVLLLETRLAMRAEERTEAVFQSEAVFPEAGLRTRRALF
jgi:hypothetical protein